MKDLKFIDTPLYQLYADFARIFNYLMDGQLGMFFMYSFMWLFSLCAIGLIMASISSLIFKKSIGFFLPIPVIASVIGSALFGFPLEIAALIGIYALAIVCLSYVVTKPILKLLRNLTILRWQCIKAENPSKGFYFANSLRGNGLLLLHPFGIFILAAMVLTYRYYGSGAVAVGSDEPTDEVGSRFGGWGFEQNLAQRLMDTEFGFVHRPDIFNL